MPPMAAGAPGAPPGSPGVANGNGLGTFVCEGGGGTGGVQGGIVVLGGVAGVTSGRPGCWIGNCCNGICCGTGWVAGGWAGCVSAGG
jgi:hypothetical protein